MLKRITMWKLKDFAQKESKIAKACVLKEMLHQLPDKVPGIEHYKIALNIADDPAAADVVLISFFADRQAYSGVIEHPEHKKVMDYANTIKSDQWFVEYED